MTNVKPGLLGKRFAGKVLDFTTLRGCNDASDPYGGFSVCDYTGDVASHYCQCRMELAKELGIGLAAVVQPRQVHGAHVEMLDGDFWSLDEVGRRQVLDGVDGMVTSRRRVVVGVNTADCVPVLLYSSGGVPLVAAVHAGWRGTLAGIAANAVEAMRNAGGEEIAAYIGVSICCDCFEVGDEVAEAFVGAGFSGKGIVTRNEATGKAHINLQEANRWQLLQCGLSPDMIFIDGTCSRHDASGNYFSARRMGVNSGRTFTGIMLL